MSWLVVWMVYRSLWLCLHSSHDTRWTTNLAMC